jgi:UPF0755 protein
MGIEYMNASKLKVILIILGISFLFLAGFFLWFGLYFIQPADKAGSKQIIIIEDGTSVRDIAGLLESKGIIKHKVCFLVWSRLKGYSHRLKSGEYNLSPSMSPAGIFNILTRGLIVLHPVTFPEGYSAEQIATTLAQKIKMDKMTFLSLVHDPAILKKYNIPGSSLEGYLYPDTYQFGRRQSPQSVIETMVGRFNGAVSSLKQRVAQSGMTLDKVVTLASIVEKETGSSKERPVIANVFLNRIKKGMRLESDPTVIYGIRNFNGDLTRDDLKRYSPYNTYVIEGLPPGPISNPGLDSIKAVLYPVETGYLYFVSKNDGTHYFSRTLEEHNRAVLIYQKKQLGVDIDRGARRKVQGPR